MNKTEALEISNEAFALFPTLTYPISAFTDTHDILTEECAVLPLNGIHKLLALAIANHSAFSRCLHVGDVCNVTIPSQDTPKIIPSEPTRASNGTFYVAAHTRVLVCATVRASIPCGEYSLYLAEVTEAKFAQ